MPERPPIEAVGRIVAELEPGRLYRAEMPNGHLAYAILERKGPPPPGDPGPVGREARLLFSPFDFSKARIAEWR